MDILLRKVHNKFLPFLESFHGEELTCKPGFQIVAVVATIVGLMHAVVWIKGWWRFSVALNELRRNDSRCIADVRRKKKAAKGYNTRSSEKEALPKISVLLPVKGVHSQKLDHWKHQLQSSHGGDIEYIFCMESKEDPAYEAVKEFKKTADKPIKIIVAGLSFYCSQKIHNLLQGVKHIAPDSQYVLFLDDDSEMQSSIFRDLIYHAQTDPSAMVVTGWPHEYIPANMKSVPFAGYLLLGYRKLAFLNLAFDYPPALWGGCLIMRREDLFDEKVGILSAWQNHGYSDDMIIAGRVYESFKRLRHPATCMMVNAVDEDYTVAKHWNFMCRQMFVCGTYTCTAEKIQNSLLLILCCWIVLGLCFWFQLLSVACLFRLLSRLAAGKLTIASWDVDCGLFHTPSVILELSIVGTCLLFFSTSMIVDDIITKMCQHLSDQPDKLQHRQPFVSHLVRSFFGLMGQMFVQSFTAFLTFLNINKSIVWSGVRYYRAGGTVCSVWRTNKQGLPYTVPLKESLHRCLQAKVVAE